MITQQQDPGKAAGSPNTNAKSRSDRQFTPGRPIVLVEKRALIRDCISKALVSSYGLDVIAVQSVQELLNKPNSVIPGIILFFISEWPIDGEIIGEMEALAKSASPPPVVVLSDDDNIQHVIHALEHGARGYIATTTSLDVFVEALGLMMAGGTFIPASSVVAAQRTGENGKGVDSQLNGAVFTARQAAIIGKLKTGKSNKLIAYELAMCESTVKVHVRNIMKKLNAKNRTEVAFIANSLPR